MNYHLDFCAWHFFKHKIVTLPAESPVHWGNAPILQVGKCNKDIIFQWDKQNKFKLMFSKHNLSTFFILFHQITLANDCWTGFFIVRCETSFPLFIARTFDRPNQNKCFKRSKACCKWDQWVSEWVWCISILRKLKYQAKSSNGAWCVRIWC